MAPLDGRWPPEAFPFLLALPGEKELCFGL